MRRAIEQAAAGIDQLDVLHLRSVRGALKHHMLEQVGEAAAALRLKAKTNFVVDADGHHRRGCIRHDDHLQAIRQRGVFHCDLRSVHPLLPMYCTFALLFSSTTVTDGEPSAVSRVRTSSAKRFSAS